ncbi:MAG: hydroxymethylglutaryl-CoA synthase [Chloroflexi bacterium]|nr:MAG: hydroxymethylglutaryl-CoA synthase [Chloroflexota bacterium]RLC97390.1 MAG: hydroxymethylglutaryl-CoA synthase [Chloroflexota bacterium]
MAGIIGYGVYVPRYRLKQADAAIPWGGFGMGEKSVCGWDEDIISMAAEALENAVNHSGVNASDIGALYLGTASSPYIEQHVAPILAETLGLSPEVSVLDYCGSINAVAAALLSCLDAIEAKRIKTGIVVGTENRRVGPGTEGEVSFGAAAVALVIGDSDTIADIEGRQTYSTLFYDRWRAAKDSWVSNYFDYRFAREYGYQRHVSGACKGLLENLQRKGDDYDHVVFHQPDGRLPALAARDLKINPQKLAPDLTGALGDLGGCSPFVSLAGILDNAKPGAKVLVCSYGSGRSDAFSLVVGNQIEKKRGNGIPLEKYMARKAYLDYPTYLRLTNNLVRAPY